MCIFVKKIKMSDSIKALSTYLLLHASKVKAELFWRVTCHMIFCRFLSPFMCVAS